MTTLFAGSALPVCVFLCCNWLSAMPVVLKAATVDSIRFISCSLQSVFTVDFQWRWRPFRTCVGPSLWCKTGFSHWSHRCRELCVLQPIGPRNARKCQWRPHPTHLEIKEEGQSIAKLTVVYSLSTQVPDVFCEAVKKTSGNGGTESHFHAVGSCQVCLLNIYATNQSPGCYHDSSNQEEDQILTLLKSLSPWCGMISQLSTVTRGFLSLPRNQKRKLLESRI